MSFFVDAELTVWREPRCAFVARFHVGGVFYSGSGDAAFDAIAWCLDDYVRRGLLGHDPSPARSADAKPGERLDVPVRRARRITPGAVAAGELAASGSAGCVGGSIPTSPAPRLFGQTPPPSTKRRARR